MIESRAHKHTRIAFILATIGHVRYKARIDGLCRCNVEACVLGFTRDYYPSGYGSLEMTSLGHISHGEYLQRLFPLLRAVLPVRRACANADWVYAFSLDILALGYVASRFLKHGPSFVYEVGDIQGILIQETLFGHCLRWLECFLIRQTRAIVVVTSQAYVDGYFLKMQSLRNVRYHLIENKVDPKKFPQPLFQASRPRTWPLRIGYFGNLRCIRSLDILKRLSSANSAKYHVYLRGYPLGLNDFHSQIREVPAMEYGGTYRNPEELPGMYEQIDLGWIAQAHAVANTRWSRVNRFYECCYFKRPMIAQAGTQDAKDVEKYDLGVVIDMHNPDSCVERLLQMSLSDLDRWHRNLLTLAQAVYTLQDEHERLRDLIEQDRAAK